MSTQKKKVLIRGPLLTRSGYGEQARFAYRALKSRPDLFDVYLAPTNWGQTGWISDDNDERREMDSVIRNTTVHAQQCQQQGVLAFDASIQVTIPQEWQRITPKNIGYTAGTETTLISHKWVESCQNVDRIIAVSEHTKAAFENTEYEGRDSAGNTISARCTTPIDVVGFPTKQLEPVELDFKPETKFNFLVVAQWSDRKNLPETLQGFMREFNDNEDVGLIIKTSLAKNSYVDRIYTEARLKQYLKNYDKAPWNGKPRKCKLYLLHGNMSDEEMAGLYRHPNVNAFINLAHGEGFGLPIFEAAQAGLPIVAPNWGGIKDYMNAYVTTKRGAGKKARKSHGRMRFLGQKVDFSVKPIQKEAVWDGVLIPESSWCFPHEKSFMRAMRKIYKSYDLALSDAKKLKAHVEKEFSEEIQQNKFVESVLETLEASSPQSTSVITL